MKNFLAVSLIAIFLNVLTIYYKFDYLLSVISVLGGVSLLLFINSFKTFSKENWKLFSVFFLFSNLSTLFIEYLMIHFDVWSFSNRVQHLTGITFLKYPIEEFVYWALCPLIVSLSYISFGKTFQKFLNPISFTNTIKNFKSILETLKNDVKIKYQKETKVGEYESGKKVPVYIWLQVIIVSLILLLKNYYRGNFRNLLYATFLFFFTAFPHEVYAVSNGFWIYNHNKMLGLYLFQIPLEGYLMYFISPICGCMILDVFNRIFFKKDL